MILYRSQYYLIVRLSCRRLQTMNTSKHHVEIGWDVVNEQPLVRPKTTFGSCYGGINSFAQDLRFPLKTIPARIDLGFHAWVALWKVIIRDVISLCAKCLCLLFDFDSFYFGNLRPQTLWSLTYLVQIISNSRYLHYFVMSSLYLQLHDFIGAFCEFFLVLKSIRSNLETVT